MSTSSHSTGESAAVLAFIRENQRDVLRGTIASLESSSPDALRSAVHAALGALGSYQLGAAHDLIAELSAVLADPATTDAAAQAAQGRTVAALRAIESDLTDGLGPRP